MLRPADADDVVRLTGFIRDAVAGAGCRGVVLGLSGGLDSVTVAELCIRALGAEEVVTVSMPLAAGTDVSGPGRGSDHREVAVQPVIDAFIDSHPAAGRTRVDIGNAVARIRMAVLYDIARREGRLVVGTTNRSELMLGYFTKSGDGAADIRPLAGLYKTQVRQLAGLLGVPQAVIDQAPSAGLWEGQTDEGDLGLPYTDLDRILEGLASSMDDGMIAGLTGIPAAGVAAVRARTEATRHKRMLPPSPPVRPGRV